MARFFLSKSTFDPASGRIAITGGDARHIALSLRMAVGDRLTVCDMQKTEYLCSIEKLTPEQADLKILETRGNDTELPVHAHLYQSLPKGDKMDYIVQKAVELGVYSITPVASARCIVKLDPKKAEDKRQRWQRIAEEAAKQCGRGVIPEVRAPMAFAAAIREAGAMEHTVFCYEGDGTVSLKDIFSPIRDSLQNTDACPEIAFFIGPEGGYEIGETEAARNAGMRLANLGKRILRCETASGFVLSAMIYGFEL